jgi:hypothetical protein
MLATSVTRRCAATAAVVSKQRLGWLESRAKEVVEPWAAQANNGWRITATLAEAGSCDHELMQRLGLAVGQYHMRNSVPPHDVAGVVRALSTVTNAACGNTLHYFCKRLRVLVAAGAVPLVEVVPLVTIMVRVLGTGTVLPLTWKTQDAPLPSEIEAEEDDIDQDLEVGTESDAVVDADAPHSETAEVETDTAAPRTICGVRRALCAVLESAADLASYRDLFALLRQCTSSNSAACHILLQAIDRRLGADPAADTEDDTRAVRGVLSVVLERFAGQHFRLPPLCNLNERVRQLLRGDPAEPWRVVERAMALGCSCGDTATILAALFFTKRRLTAGGIFPLASWTIAAKALIRTRTMPAVLSDEMARYAFGYANRLLPAEVGALLSLTARVCGLKRQDTVSLAVGCDTLQVEKLIQRINLLSRYHKSWSDLGHIAYGLRKIRDPAFEHVGSLVLTTLAERTMVHVPVDGTRRQFLFDRSSLVLMAAVAPFPSPAFDRAIESVIDGVIRNISSVRLTKKVITALHKRPLEDRFVSGVVNDLRVLHVSYLTKRGLINLLQIILSRRLAHKSLTCAALERLHALDVSTLDEEDLAVVSIACVRYAYHNVELQTACRRRVEELSASMFA